MIDGKKQEYTLKITNANKSQLVVIIYDIALDYLAESKEAYKMGNNKKFRDAVIHAQKCVENLITGLDLEYEVSHMLWRIYFYINRRMIEAVKNVSIEPINEIDDIIIKLRSSFDEISKSDSSGPMMGNTQSIVAGITYGRNTLNEALQNNGENRGYFV